MTMAWVALYVVVFVAGPALVLYLLRVGPTGRRVRALGGVVAGLIILAFSLQFLNLGGMIAVLGLLWLSWAVSMALVGQVLRLLLEDAPGARRWTAVLAAIGSTLPWFGILIARTLVG